MFGMGTGGSPQLSPPDDECAYYLGANLFATLIIVPQANAFSRPSRRKNTYRHFRRPKPSKLHRRENKRVFLFKFTCQCMLPEGNTRKLLIQSLTLCKFDPLNHSFRSDSVSFKSSPRHISTGQLNALLQLHTRPINLIFFKVSYQIAL